MTNKKYPKHGLPPSIFADGFLFRANPSPTGGGYTVVNKQGEVLAREIIEQPGLTNNEAELRGLIRAIELAEKRSSVGTDSRVARAWVCRGRSRARRDLRTILKRTRKLLLEKEVEIVFVPRELNPAGILNDRQRPARSARAEIADWPQGGETKP